MVTGTVSQLKNLKHLPNGIEIGASVLKSVLETCVKFKLTNAPYPKMIEHEASTYKSNTQRCIIPLNKNWKEIYFIIFVEYFSRYILYIY